MVALEMILQVVVGLSFLALGLVAVIRPERLAEVRWIGSSGRVLGVLMVLGGVVTLVATQVPFLTFFAAVLDSAVVAGVWTKLSGLGVERLGTVAGTLLAGSLAMGVLQPLGLKVLLLPRADKLAYVPVPTRTVKTYGAGAWFESVGVGPDGTLYLSCNRGDNYATGDKSQAQGQVIARSPAGEERVVFTLPMGSTSGVFAIAADGTLYLTGTGAELGIWRITPQGAATLMTRLPRGAWPNGLDFGPDGKLYSADSALGVIWRVDPATGRAERVIEDPLLKARRLISLAPGANGIHFRGQEMLVTVSDRTTVLGYVLQADGRFGGPVVVATGIPGDDFAIGQDGSLFVTTHPYNTVVRIAPDGSRSVIADARDNIVGATDAAFGRTPEDSDTLYVVTDGGAFQGGRSARGALIALKPFARR